jgi:hypothetical protein
MEMHQDLDGPYVFLVKTPKGMISDLKQIFHQLNDSFLLFSKTILLIKYFLYLVFENEKLV